MSWSHPSVSLDYSFLQWIHRVLQLISSTSGLYSVLVPPTQNEMVKTRWAQHMSEQVQPTHGARCHSVVCCRIKLLFVHTVSDPSSNSHRQTWMTNLIIKSLRSESGGMLFPESRSNNLPSSETNRNCKSTCQRFVHMLPYVFQMLHSF